MLVMRKYISSFAFLLIFVGFVACSNNKSAIKGSWIKVSENGIPANRKHIKHYTDKNFTWQMVDNNIINESAAGEYKVEGDELYEFIQMAMNYNGVLIGRTAKINIKIKGDTLTNSTVIPMNGQDLKFTEKWVRIK